ncbi:uncharacterized protein LOC103708518 isoform X2 [Phoenix dactylifera]|uniref:Uncharacterized protein LOC103708518 isoform X2 n=1 Tax=Phoenix dactylifera TaxID=42345 RepID=A0A8B8ZVJ7_PHODC|nr:uncharacterized protein LOC103708518 isoform X2 [Phoenix dactylifera]
MTTTTLPTAIPMLPTSAAAAASRPRRHCCPRPPRRCGPAASAIAAAALLLASSAWISLVFSSLSPLPLRRLRSWDSSSSAAAPLSSPTAPPPPPDGSTTRFSSADSSSPDDDSAAPLSLRHVVFGIAGSAQFWPRRREFLRLWWRPGAMRGHVWLDDRVPRPRNASLARAFPPIRVSEDISRFRYTNPTGHPSGLRISRIVAESFRLGHRGARWFVLVDDDTILCPDNLVAVLGKYDWTEMVYIGAPSESHSANTYFSHSMAFGGGGIAISYPLAKALSRMQDECLERYPRLYGSDDRLHACISELGVPLTREYGFHQWDIRGNPHGLLAAHPIAPFISIHHVEAVDPIYPGLSLLESLKLFAKAMKTDPQSFLQRAISYDRRKKLTFSVSLGYVVQVFPHVILPRELERSEQTYIAWNRRGNRNEFDFDTRDVYRREMTLKGKFSAFLDHLLCLMWMKFKYWGTR